MPNSVNPRRAFTHTRATTLIRILKPAAVWFCIMTAVAEVAHVGPPLPSEIVGLFVPPTRSDEPYAATAQDIFRYNPDGGEWSLVYSALRSEASIQGVGGYAKSSKVLYVVHSKGGAVTGDGGEKWREFGVLAPSEQVGGFIGIAVHPTDRREAILSWEKGAWITHDYGESFAPLNLPDSPSDLQQGAYAGGDSAPLVVATSTNLFISSAGTDSWIRLRLSTNGPSVFALTDQPPIAFVASTAGCQVYDLARPGYTATWAAPADFEADTMVADPSGRPLLWAQHQTRLSLLEWHEGNCQIRSVHESTVPLQLLTPHPRIDGGLYWAEGSQLMLLTDGFALASDTDPLNLAALSLGPLEILSLNDAQISRAHSFKAADVLEETLAQQPPLERVVEAALSHATFDHDEVVSWKKKVRSRNFLPKLRVGGGAREYPYDQTALVSETDRYGITTMNDLRLSDGVRNYGYVAAFVEWDLAKLLWDPEQVDLNKEKRYAARSRNDLIETVTRLYFERLDRLVKYNLHETTLTEDEKLTTLIKIWQNAEILNGLCGQRLFGVE